MDVRGWEKKKFSFPNKKFRARHNTRCMCPTSHHVRFGRIAKISNFFHLFRSRSRRNLVTTVGRPSRAAQGTDDFQCSRRHRARHKLQTVIRHDNDYD